MIKTGHITIFDFYTPNQLDAKQVVFQARMND